MDKAQTETVHAVIPTYVRNELRKQANANNTTLSWVIKEVCTRFVDERMKVVSGVTYVKKPAPKLKAGKRRGKVKC